MFALSIMLNKFVLVSASSPGNENHQLENDTSNDETTKHFTFKWNQAAGMRCTRDLDVPSGHSGKQYIREQTSLLIAWNFYS